MPDNNMYSGYTSWLFAAAVLVVVIAAGWILWLGQLLLIPLLLAVFVWYLIDAVARYVHSLLPGSEATAIPPASIHFIFLGLLFVIFFIAAGNLLDAIDLVRAELPRYRENIAGIFGAVIPATSFEQHLPDMEQITGSINFAVITGTVLGTITSMVGNSMAVLLYVVFLVLEQHIFRHKLRALCGSEERSNMVSSMLQHIGSSIRKYVWLKSILAFATGGASYVVLLVAGVDFAVFWGVVIFALTYIPYIGALLSVLLPAMLALAQFGQWDKAVAVLVGLTVVQIVLGHVVEPKLFGRSLNISPLAVLFSLAFWGAMWGGIGMFLAVPITVVTMIVCAHIPQLRSVAIIISADSKLPG